MKLAFVVCVIVAISTAAYSQSGRRAKEIKAPVSAPEDQVKEPEPKPQQDEPPPVTAERNKDYRCTDDGSLALILDTEPDREQVFSAKQVDSRVVITAKPAPGYTKEARRYGIQGFVTLKLLLSGNGKISRVRIVSGLPPVGQERSIF